MKQLDPKYVWLYFVSSSIGLSFLFIFLFVVFGPFFFGTYTLFATIVEGQRTNSILDRIPALMDWWIFIVLALFLNFIWAHLTWRFYKYELRDDGFRKEHGVIWKKYVTIPYERIQNVDIYRGPLDRIFGISDLTIETAGSYGGAEGRLPCLSPQVAEQLRDELIKRSKGKQQQGL